MTPTADIDELRTELHWQSRYLAKRLAVLILALGDAQIDAIDADETHVGGTTIGGKLADIANRILALVQEGHRLQALRRRILDAEDTADRRVAS